MTTTKAEQETILRFDQDERVLHLYPRVPPKPASGHGWGMRWKCAAGCAANPGAGGHEHR